jgi:hypothetical protein
MEIQGCYKKKNIKSLTQGVEIYKKDACGWASKQAKIK